MWWAFRSNNELKMNRRYGKRHCRRHSMEFKLYQKSVDTYGTEKTFDVPFYIGKLKQVIELKESQLYESFI